MSELHMLILAALMDIHRFGPKDNTLGICANVTQILGDGDDHDFLVEEAVDNALCALFESWPDKSTSTAYPVGNWSMFPSKIFWEYHDDRRSMWADNKYGTARKALLDHCIATLELNQ